MTSSGRSARAQQVLAAIFEPFDRIFAALDEIGAGVEALDATARADGRRLTRDDCAALRTLLLGRLADQQPLTAGIGAVFAPGVLADTDRWLEWYWRRDASSAPTFLQLPLDPAYEDFYDYERAAWFNRPRETLDRTIVGPHVDHGATRQHLVTPCTPILGADGGFLGVAAADLRVSEIEPMVLPHLRALGEAGALVNADGRVIASNTPAWMAGSLICDRRASPLVTAATPAWSETAGFGLVRRPGYLWALAVALPARSAAASKAASFGEPQPLAKS